LGQMFPASLRMIDQSVLACDFSDMAEEGASGSIAVWGSCEGEVAGVEVEGGEEILVLGGGRKRRFEPCSLRKD